MKSRQTKNKPNKKTTKKQKNKRRNKKQQKNKPNEKTNEKKNRVVFQVAEASLLELIILVFPAYVANAIPVVFGGGQAIDYGKKLWGERVFGASKTIRGALSGFAFGTTSGIAIAFTLSPFFLPQLGVMQKVAVAFALSLGTIVGDLLGSFMKRRLGIKPGAQSLLLDQLPFLYTALFFAWLAWSELPTALGVTGFFFLTILTILLHLFFNLLAHAFRLKKVPW